MDGNASSAVPVQAGTGGGQGKRRSSTTGADGEEESDEEPSSSSSPIDVESPMSALENFRKQWEEELHKIPVTSDVHSTLNLVSASPASLANPYPNPTSMAGAVARSSTASSDPTQQQGYHPFASAAAGIANNASTGGSPVVDVPTTVPETGTIEEQARRWFLQGIGFERHGDLYDAVRCYRRAIQLVPDIEYRISSGLTTGGANANKYDESDDDSDDSISEYSHNVEKPNPEEGEDCSEEERGPLVRRFLKQIERSGWLFFEKGAKSDKTHISKLPVEVISYIMRWVVSSELDARSLDMLSGVNKGFYCISRDEKLWQMICERVWSSCAIGHGFSSYREMFLNRPRVRFDGCYISRITYIRPGENSFQDRSYRPWHFVEYYRYIRFFPDGQVHFLTCSEEPVVSVPGLREKNPRNLATLTGTYQLYGNNVVTAMVKKIPPPNSGFKSKRQENQQTTSFHIEFEICPLKGKNNSLLKWVHHAAFITKTVSNKGRNVNACHNQNTSSVVSTTFEISPTKYPSLYFSRVKSYLTSSERILE